MSSTQGIKTIKYFWIQGIKVTVEKIKTNHIELSWNNQDKMNIGSYPFHHTKEERQLQMIYKPLKGICIGGRFDDNEFTFNVSDYSMMLNKQSSFQISQAT